MPRDTMTTSLYRIETRLGGLPLACGIPLESED